MFNMMATKLFFKFLAFLIPVFLVCSAAGLAGLSRHALRGNVEEVTARVGNHAARVAVTLGRHQPDQIGEALAYDLMGSLMSDQAVVCVQWTPVGAGKPALTVPRVGGCGAAAEDNQSVQSVTLLSGRSGAKLTVKFATTEIEQAAQRYFTYSALILLMSALAALVAAGVGFRWVVCKPLRSLRIAIRTGDRTGQPQAVGKKPSDEIGEVIAAYDALVERHRDASESFQRESRQRALEEQRSAFAGKLQSSVEQLRRSLVDIAANLSREVSAMADVSGRLDGAAKGMLGSMSSAQSQSEKNLETAAMAQQLVSGLQGVSQEIETHAINTNMAGEAVNAAGASMQEKLNELERAQNRIASLSGMIAQIASQTNLLALNATIEAARAGEAGRGFAVVASEVKTLALTTAKATIDINAAVSEIGEKLQETRRAGMTFREAGELIAVASGEIKTAVIRQSDSLSSVTNTSAAASEAAAAVSHSLAAMAELSSQTRAASGSVAEASGAIAGVDDALRRAVEKFLNEIAA